MSAVRITARRGGFRRCGVAHPARPVEYPDGRFDEAGIARLEAEPMLAVERLPALPAVAKPAGSAGSADPSAGETPRRKRAKR